MREIKVFWTTTAEKDLLGIIEHIALDSPQTAQKKFDLIRDKASQLEMFPEEGRIIPELERQSIRSYREIIIAPWRLMYKIEGNKGYVLAVIDGRRNIEDILLNRHIR